MSARCPAYTPNWANSYDLMSFHLHHRTARTLGGDGDKSWIYKLCRVVEKPPVSLVSLLLYTMLVLK